MKKSKLDPPESPEALEARLEELARKLDRLRALYESFFLGVERAPPAVARRELNRLVLEMQQVHINNASMRFRFQSILQRWVLLTSYWNRTLREIESGTYRRDIARVQKHLAQKGSLLTEADAIALGIPATRAKAFVDRQQRMRVRRGEVAAAADGQAPATATATPLVAAATPPAQSAAPARAPAPAVTPAPPPPGSVPGVSERQVEAFFAKYMDAHVQVQGAAPKLTLDQLKDRLRKELPRVLEAKNCQAVDLDVAIEDGKVRLKARPVRG